MPQHPRLSFYVPVRGVFAFHLSVIRRHCSVTETYISFTHVLLWIPVLSRPFTHANKWYAVHSKMLLAPYIKTTTMQILFLVRKRLEELKHSEKNYECFHYQLCKWAQAHHLSLNSVQDICSGSIMSAWLLFSKKERKKGSVLFSRPVQLAHSPNLQLLVL